MATAWMVYITTADQQEARSISDQLLAHRLAACTNLLSSMESAYWWEGQIQRSTECVLIAKTWEHQLEALQAKVRELHSYECPCIVAWPMEKGEPNYISWIKEQVQ